MNALPQFPKAVITTGSFDGVHTGHLLILEQLLKEAAEIDGNTRTYYVLPASEARGTDKR